MKREHFQTGNLSTSVISFSKTLENSSFRLYYFQLSIYTVDPVYSERIGAAKSVHLRRIFTINVFNLTIN